MEIWNLPAARSKKGYIAMRLCSIASGSSGNCIYVGSDCAHVLVDVGISKKRIEEGLRSIDMDVRDMDGILITHEHSDHMKGLGVMSRKYHLPIYATRGTIEAIQEMASVGECRKGFFMRFKKTRNSRLKI